VIEESVERIEVPTPFNVGSVNCYLIASDEVTLLDPGPATDPAYDTVRTRLNEEGVNVTEIDRILITHAHIDHFGLAGRLKQESCAEVIAHEYAVDRITTPDEHLASEQAFFRPFLSSMGMPEDLVDAVLKLPEQFAWCRDPIDVSRKLAEGDTVDVGTPLEVLHTPGHAPDSICFLSRKEDAAFTGDHVLAGISPNPLLTVRPNATNKRTRSLPAFIGALKKIRDAGIEDGYPGHGRHVTNVTRRADEIRRHHLERKEKIANLLEAEEPKTAYELVEDTFPDVPEESVLPAMSEVIGHLDLLEDEGRVETIDSGKLTYYGPQ